MRVYKRVVTTPIDLTGNYISRKNLRHFVFVLVEVLEPKEMTRAKVFLFCVLKQSRGHFTQNLLRSRIYPGFYPKPGYFPDLPRIRDLSRISRRKPGFFRDSDRSGYYPGNNRVITGGKPGYIRVFGMLYQGGVLGFVITWELSLSATLALGTWRRHSGYPFPSRLFKFPPHYIRDLRSYRFFCPRRSCRPALSF